MQVGERADRRKLDHAEQLTLEDHRDDHQVRGRCLGDAGADHQSLVRGGGDPDHLPGDRGLADESLPRRERDLVVPAT